MNREGIDELSGMLGLSECVESFPAGFHSPKVAKEEVVVAPPFSPLLNRYHIGCGD